MLIRIDGLTRRIAARTLFEGVTLEVRAGDRIGFLGPNGAGKSTLLRMLADGDPADGGHVARARGVDIGLLRQEIDPSLDHSVFEEASRAFAHLDALEDEMTVLEAEMAGLGERGEEVPAGLASRYDDARTRFERGGGFEREAAVERVLEGLGFDAAARERPVRTFSGGWLMRVELAKLLLVRPDVLLLDEPTNHLDLPSIQWFEATLEDYPGAVMAVTHDRAFLRRFARRMLELDGHGGWEAFDGGYDAFLAMREERREQLEATKRNQDRRAAEIERFVERFRYKASKARQVQSRVKLLEKMDRVELAPDRRRRMRLRIPAPPRSGEIAMKLEGVHKSFGETVVYRGIDVEVRRGEKLALAGPNGAGKSTLLRILAGVLPIDAGERRPGHHVQVAYYAQHQLEALQPGRTVYEELAAGAPLDDVPRLRGHLGAFLFSGDDVEKRVSVLSGGEKARLALAKLLLRPANLLVLDEPTNHLDLEACEVLEQALAAYHGTLVFTTHDRALINALATRVLEVKPGELHDFAGNYDEYLRRTSAVTAPRADPGPAPQAPAATPDPLPAAEASRPPDKATRQRDRERKKARDRVARKIERLEAEILEGEEFVEALGHRMADPAVASDADRLQELDAERSTRQAAVEELYRDWDRLTAELESLDDAP